MKEYPPPRPADNGLPEWLRHPAVEDRSLEQPRTRLSLGAAGFTERTLGTLAESAQKSLLSERYAASDGLLQQVDPRAKILACLLLVAVISAIHAAAVIGALALAALALAVASRIPMRVFLVRAWIAAPLFAGAAVLPAALNLVTPGAAVWTILESPSVTVTDAGLRAVGLLTLRIATAVSFIALLPLTTRWPDLIGGLRGLGLSRPFVGVMAMTHRYAALLARAAGEAFTARRSRALRTGRGPQERAYAGRLAGVIMEKAHGLSLEVHAAMLSRGWTGEVRAPESPGFRLADVALLVGAAALSALALLGGRLG